MTTTRVTLDRLERIAFDSGAQIAVEEFDADSLQFVAIGLAAGPDEVVETV